ncbi:uncharacterized protein LOC107262760 isoform X2 [Cephus cinctus]|nr:uncharacterized protein LOC107262760 isoform X2 [Cephus cinctus]
MDLTSDRIKDCIASGRGGILHAINGHDGSSIWELPLQDLATPGQQRILDVYDARYMPDIDEDGVGDVIASHTLQSGGTRNSEILILSGKTGSIIHSVALPETEQLFLAPQTFIHPDGENIFVIATSSQRQSGGLYIVPQSNLIYGDLKLRKLHHKAGKKVLLSPVLADITSDGTEDIIAAMLNSTIIAYNGITFEQIWNYTVPNSEVISVPIPGYYNDDDVPDFMVKHQIGPGFPNYYYTVATVIDGKTGKVLLEKSVEDSMSGQMSGLSVTVDGFGNDWFLHWSADCLNHEASKIEYQFLKTESLISQTRADLCKLLFNSTLTTKLLALSQHVEPPGIPLYISDDWKKLEFNNSIDPRREAEKYLETHPDFEAINNNMDDVPAVSERSPRVRKPHHKTSSFRHKENNDLFAEQNNYYPNRRVSKGKSINYENSENFKEIDESLDNDQDLKVVPHEFGNGEEWRETNKWEDEIGQSEKDLDVLYEEGDPRGMDTSQMNEIREQRSDANDMRTINNDTNEFQNQLDPGMDYTNGQTKYNNYYPLETTNRSTNSKNTETYLNISDYDFVDDEDSNEDNDLPNGKEKRQAYDENDKLGTVGQKEIIIGKVDDYGSSDTFLPIVKKKKKATLTDFERKLNPIDSHDIKMEDNVIDKDKHITLRNIELHESIEILPISEALLENMSSNADVSKRDESSVNFIRGVNKAVKNMNKSTRFEGDFLSKIIIAKRKSTPSTKNINIGRIFKRESLKNLKKLINNQKLAKDENIIKISNRKRKRGAQVNDDKSNTIEGIQRQPPTGILLPSLTTAPDKTSVDIVFSTFWLPPSEASIILLPQDLECISRKKAELDSKVQDLDNEQTVSDCLTERGFNYKLYQESVDRENVRIALGQMTVYRMKLECVCPEDMLPGQTCKNISREQSWPAHLGSSANGYFKPLRRPST